MRPPSVRTIFSWLATRTSVRYLQIELSPISDSQYSFVMNMLEASFDRKMDSNRARSIAQQYGRNTMKKASTVERQSVLMIESIKIHWNWLACQRWMQTRRALEQYASILSAGSLSSERFFNLLRLRLNCLTEPSLMLLWIRIQVTAAVSESLEPSSKSLRKLESREALRKILAVLLLDKL